jgi:hypothetical protein
MNDSTQRGNAPAEYKEIAEPARLEGEKVRMWRGRIDRAYRELAIEDRIKEAEAADFYLNLTTETEDKDRLYVPYLRSHLNDMHRRTLPAIPTPWIESRDESADSLEDTVRAIVDRDFTSSRCGVKRTVRKLMWDDDRFGIAIGKTVWRLEVKSAEIDPTRDETKIALEIDKATAENDAPLAALVNEQDLHDVHLRIHGEKMDALPGYVDWPLYEHIQQHRAMTQVLVSEGPVLERVPAERFVYDTDVPWEERGWEAELRTLGIQDMLDMGYRNVNPGNCPSQDLGDGANVYEDMTALVWLIHDRKDGKEYVISAQGPRDGYFLHKGPWTYGDIDIYQKLVFGECQPQHSHGVPVIRDCLPILDDLAFIEFHIKRHVENHSDYKLGGPKSAGDPAIKAGLKDPNRRFVFEGSPESWAMMKEIKPPPIPDTLLQHKAERLSDLRRATATDAQDVGASNPHQITATESANRGVARDDRKRDRQEIVSDFLSAVALNFLRLRKKFGEHSISIRVLGNQGASFDQIDPASIPTDIEVLFDVRGQTDEARQAQAAAWSQYFEARSKLGQMVGTDWTETIEDFARALGIRRPEKHRGQLQPTMPSGLPQGQTLQFPGQQALPQLA